jgi:hypothetical protein
MMVTVPVERLVFVDESGFYTRMTPLYACAPRGERAYGHVPRNHTRNTTLVAALSRAGWPRSFAVACIAVSCHRRNRTKPCHPSLPAFVCHHVTQSTPFEASFSVGRNASAVGSNMTQERPYAQNTTSRAHLVLR